MNLKTYMKKYGITQRVMADRLGITISHLRMVMLGSSSPSKKLAIRMEKVTNGEITKEEAIFYEPGREDDEDTEGRTFRSSKTVRLRPQVY